VLLLLLLLWRKGVCAGVNVVLYCLQLLGCLHMQCLLLLLLLCWQQHVWLHMQTQGCLRQVCWCERLSMHTCM
jgi:hypothetical protein